MLLISMGPAVPRTKAAANHGRGEGAVNRMDPCTILPAPPGNANGIDKLCPASGSSSGVSRGDFNGDGFADLAISEPGARVSNQDGAGDLIIVYGSANGLSGTAGPGMELWTLSRAASLNPVAGDGFGTALASGDFNGDGFSDLAIGVPGRKVKVGGTDHDHAGAVVILFGSSTGLHTGQVIDADTLDQIHSCQITYDNARFGQALTWGNFNGDQHNGHDIGDLAIGIPGAGTVSVCGLTTFANAGGAVWVIAGSAPDGLNPQTNTLFRPDTLGSVDHRLDGERFGSSLTAFNATGKGFDHLAVGAPFRTTGLDPTFGACFGVCVSEVGAIQVIDSFFISGAENAGRTEITIADFNLTAAAKDHFGASLAGGDFDGNGLADLAIGIPGRKSGGQAGAGAVGVLYVASTTGEFGGIFPLVGVGTAPQIWDETSVGGVPQSNDQFGSALAANDFNDDGRADLAVGVPFKAVTITRSGAQVTLVNAGEVDVIYGSASGLAKVRSPQRWNQDSATGGANAGAGNTFGASLTAWNFGHEEFSGTCPICIRLSIADLAIGVPLDTVNGISGAGSIAVLYGSAHSNGLASTNRQMISADSLGLGGLSGAHFGAALY
jgi:hypothetical protein